MAAANGVCRSPLEAVALAERTDENLWSMVGCCRALKIWKSQRRILCDFLYRPDQRFEVYAIDKTLRCSRSNREIETDAKANAMGRKAISIQELEIQARVIASSAKPNSKV